MKKILALILAVVLVLPLASCKKKKNKDDEKPTDPVAELTPLYELDLSRYVEIDEKYYKNYTVEIKVNSVTDEDVNEAIDQVLDSKQSLLPGTTPIKSGDTVHIFYNGYYLDDGGDKVYFDGGSNASGNACALKIGSGQFIEGFESNMIGKTPADYDTENPMVIEARFPDNYFETSLAGKTAYFEVTVDKKNGNYQLYGKSTLTESFIKETLGFTDALLAEYDGDNIVEKYKSYVREALRYNGVAAEDYIWRAFWESVLAGAVIKEYPTEYVEDTLNDIIASLDKSYQAQSAYYTYEEYACAYFGVAKGSDWRAEAEEWAKETVKQYLIFYYIMDKEGLDPTEEEFAVLLDEYLEYALELENITVDRFSTVEEFNSHKEQYRAKMVTEQGANYFKDKIYFNLGYEAVLGYANVVEITE